MAANCMSSHLPRFPSSNALYHCISYSPSTIFNSAAQHINLEFSLFSRPLLKSTYQISCKSLPVETSQQDSDSTKSRRPEKIPEPHSPSAPPFLTSFSMLRRRFKFDELGVEILSIALPAALALAADPIASLVDTAFVGHLGSVQLAAVGVSASVFNLVSKLFNVPLLNITTSFVSEEWALLSQCDSDSMGIEQGSKKLLPSISTSLIIATSIGIVEAVVLLFGSGYLLNFMGIPIDSPMYILAEHFICLRAFGAPPIVIALAAQGTFRGFMDTKTPLYAIVAGNLLNAMLDLILILFLGFGISGAAIATVTSEYFIAFILLWKLGHRVSLTIPTIDGARFASYLKSTGLLIGRTVAVVVTMTLATSMAAREGPIKMAAHQICLQVWLAVSLLTDSLALSGQALLARSYSKREFVFSQQIIYRILQIALITGTMFGIILFLEFDAFSTLFTTDSTVLEITSSGIWFVAGSQPVNAVAFAMDGLYYGVEDFGYAAYSMFLVGLITTFYLVVFAPPFGLVGVWLGLFLFMSLRVAAGIWRLGTRKGPWKMIWCNMDQRSDGS